MKNIISLTLAACLGSVITVGSFHLINKKEEPPNEVKIEYLERTPSISADHLNNGPTLVPFDFKEVSRQVMPAVVHIKSSRKVNYVNNQLSDPFKHFFQDDMFEDFFGPRFRFRSPQQLPEKEQFSVGTGSGVIINKDGYIVTNNHVINDAEEIEVTLHDNRTFKATVIGTDKSTDLALIQIKANDLATLPLVNSDHVEVGEWVLAVGNPFNLNSTATAGIVSAKGRNINILKDQFAIESFIQTDAAINPGNSGGALVNLQGGLVGINTAIASPTGAYSGYGFAIPSNIVNKVIEDLIKFGVVQRGYLGAMIRDMSGALAEEHGLGTTEGVYVDSIIEKSAAKEAGLKAGDIITKVDGKVVKSSPELLELIARHRPGDRVPIEIEREGKRTELSVTLKNREGSDELVSREKSEVLTALGAEFEALKPKEAKKLNIKGGVRIKKLYAGKLKRQTKLKEGFIITSVLDKPVTSVDELIDALNGHEGGVMLEGIYEDYPGRYYYAFGM